MVFKLQEEFTRQWAKQIKDKIYKTQDYAIILQNPI